MNYNFVIKKNNENLGICRTLNLGLSLASGRWVALLASDDFYHEDFILRMVTESIKYNTDNVVLHCDAIMIDTNNKIIGSSHNRSYLKPLSGNCFWEIAEGKGKIVPITMFASRSLYNKVGNFDQELKAEDFDMHLRMARVANYVFIDKCLVYSRITPGSLGKSARIWAKDIFSALDKHMDIDPIRIESIKKKRYIMLISKLAFESDLNHAFKLYNEYVSKYHTRIIILIVSIVINYLKGVFWRFGLRRPDFIVSLQNKLYFKLLNIIYK